MAGDNHLVFRLSDELFAIAGPAVREMVLPPRLWQPPSRPAALAGVLNLRGEAVPVVALDRLLGLAEARGGPFAPLIVLRGTDGAWAIMADAVVDVVSGEVLPATSDDGFNGCVAGMLSWGGHEAHLLTPERLLQERERAVLRDFRQMAERRLEEWRIA